VRVAVDGSTSTTLTRWRARDPCVNQQTPQVRVPHHAIRRGYR
jgi:hypothetical protein